VFAFLRIAARAIWGFLRLAPDYSEILITRDVLLHIAKESSKDLWNHAILVGVAFLLFLFNLIWLTASNMKKIDL